MQNGSSHADDKCFLRSTQCLVMLILAEIHFLIPFTIIWSISACKPSESKLKRFCPFNWCFFNFFFFLPWLFSTLLGRYKVKLTGLPEESHRSTLLGGKCQSQLETKMDENYNRNLQT